MDRGDRQTAEGECPQRLSCCQPRSVCSASTVSRPKSTGASANIQDLAEGMTMAPRHKGLGDRTDWADQSFSSCHSRRRPARDGPGRIRNDSSVLGQRPEEGSHHGRSQTLSRLHQYVHAAAAAIRQTPMTLMDAIMTIAKRAFFLMIVGATVALSAAIRSADAHDWYPVECCHGIDCATVDKVEALTPFGANTPPTMVVTTKYGSVVVPPDFPRREFSRQSDARLHEARRNRPHALTVHFSATAVIAGYHPGTRHERKAGHVEGEGNAHRSGRPPTRTQSRRE